MSLRGSAATAAISCRVNRTQHRARDCFATLAMTTEFIPLPGGEGNPRYEPDEMHPRGAERTIVGRSAPESCGRTQHAGYGQVPKNGRIFGIMSTVHSDVLPSVKYTVNRALYVERPYSSPCTVLKKLRTSLCPAAVP